MADIQDFGKKIGGARKDVWRSRGLLLHDLSEMNVMERKSNIKKENIWVKPDWEKLIEEGTPQAVAYWQSKLRQAIPPRPLDDDEITQNNYVEVVCAIRDAVMSVKDPYEINTFYKGYLQPTFITSNPRSYYVSVSPEASGVINNKVLKVAQSDYRRMKEEAEKKLFGVPKDQQLYVTLKNRLKVHRYDDDLVVLEAGDGLNRAKSVLKVGTGFGRSYYYFHENDEFSDISQWEKGSYFILDEGARKPLAINFDSREAAESHVETICNLAQKEETDRSSQKKNGTSQKRKTHFMPPQLQGIHRTGPNYRNGRSANGTLFMKDLGFRGGEFGNWLNEKDRQMSLNMAYDGLRDLARILKIKPEDISFGNRLAIAFGARGRGGANAALAHYEPDLQVINLTKMAGAGCLAHEWAHALDHAIGLDCGKTGLASEVCLAKTPEVFQDLIQSLKYKKLTLPQGEVNPELVKKIQDSERNLKNWIDHVKPSKLSSELEAGWDRVAQTILDGTSQFSGGEYFHYGRRHDTILTNPEIEILSQIRKTVTNHAIPRDSKRQIAMWAHQLDRQRAEANSKEPSEYRVETDFYKGSKEFDNNYSRSAHGYWQSDCEMFARAFDCYIADKIKEAGLSSEYLSGHADAYAFTNDKGALISAVPKGLERTILNEKFDILFDDLKQRGFLHEYVEPEIQKESVTPREIDWSIPSAPLHCEQLSFEDMILSAESRSGPLVSQKSPLRDDRSL